MDCSASPIRSLAYRVVGKRGRVRGKVRLTISIQHICVCRRQPPALLHESSIHTARSLPSPPVFRATAHLETGLASPSPAPPHLQDAHDVAGLIALAGSQHLANELALGVLALGAADLSNVTQSLQGEEEGACRR